MFAKQSHWYKRRGLLFKLRRPLAFQLSRGLLLGVYWLAGSTSPSGGRESHHFTETKTQVPAACQPQPRQPHIIKLISQLQKPTRKISDTWIIDTGKRETRYRLVKIHQTIRQPHIHTHTYNIYTPSYMTGNRCVLEECILASFWLVSGVLSVSLINVMVILSF